MTPQKKCVRANLSNTATKELTNALMSRSRLTNQSLHEIQPAKKYLRSFT